MPIHVIPKYIVCVITEDNNRHYKGYDNIIEAVEARDAALADIGEVFDAYIYQKTCY